MESKGGIKKKRTHGNKPAELRRRAVVIKVLSNVVNGKPPKISQAMIDCGYSPSVAHHQAGRVTSSKEWDDILEERFPDAYLAEKHDELIGAAQIQHYEFPLCEEKATEGEIKKLTNDDIKTIVESVPGCRLIYVKNTRYSKVAFYQSPDNKVRKDAIEMAYKLKRRLTPDAVIIDNRKTRIGKMTNKELADLEKKLAEDLLLGKKPKK